MDLSKYNNDLSDVADYLSDIGLTVDVNEFDGNYKKYDISSVDFQIHLYSFIKQEDGILFKYNKSESVNIETIGSRFLNLSNEEKQKFANTISSSFSIINIIYGNLYSEMVTITNLKDLDLFLKDNLPFYKRDNIIDDLLKD